MNNESFDQLVAFCLGFCVALFFAMAMLTIPMGWAQVLEVWP